MKLAGRIIAEKRVAIVLIALAIVANVAAYAFVLYPLQQRVSSAESRKLDAERDRMAAERELATVRATVAGEQQAESDLGRFYNQILPDTLADARKVAYLRLAQLARDANLRMERQATIEATDTREGDLKRLQVTAVLQGGYEDIRRFVHSLDTAPEFLIVDSVGLTSREEANTPLELTVIVSTYFRTDDNAV